ncbi:DUF4177 domain-containing protein [Pseudooceanicola sp.]|uniref:DUF4177 domain-containing protein n=1 Tax=Pseudooceanicola sp. TaxID=1914328 RepID=UPI002608107B|nr:DUF4177 domain-containing protein [Pseudooceanicola sp.]MDF1854355.1 DUF4177 domain-containing protein [Pseudooceanicola sp.]
MPTRYEYRVVPAPTRGVKAKGAKGPEGRFAHAIEELMNQMAAEGWEYQRAETLPSEERQGLTQTSTSFRNLLIFRRPAVSDPAPFQPRLLESDAQRPLALPDRSRQPGSTADTGEDESERVDASLAEALRRRAAQLLNGSASAEPDETPRKN